MQLCTIHLLTGTEPGVGQNIALDGSPADRKSACLFSFAFCVPSAFIVPQPFADIMCDSDFHS